MTILVALAIPVAFSLVEPPRKKLDTSQGKLRTIVNIVKYCLVEHRQLRSIITYSVVLSTTTFTAVWFIQPRLQEASLPLVWFGAVEDSTQRRSLARVDDCEAMRGEHFVRQSAFFEVLELASLVSHDQLRACLVSGVQSLRDVEEVLRKREVMAMLDQHLRGCLE